MGVSKITLNTADGEETLIDLTGDSVTPETLAEGVTAHDASGAQITGTMKSGGKSVQTDWDQTDAAAADFLKNKPFEQIIKNQRVIYAEQSFPVDPEQGGIVIDHTLFSLEEDGYIIKFDGVEYVYGGCASADGILIGNLSFFGSGEDTGEPFLVIIIPILEAAMIVVADMNDHTVGIIGGVTETKKIETKYLYKSLALYTDGTYLYNSNDTSDVTNRTDVWTVKRAFDAGVPIYLSVDSPAATFSVPVIVVFANDPNTGAAFAIVKEITDVKTEYFTAEYTPET